MTDTKPTIDEQITALRNIEGPIAKAAADSLERLKRIDAVQVQDEPEIIKHWADGPTVPQRQIIDYIDTLRDLLRRESARADRYERELAETKRLLVEAREEGRIAGLREAAELLEMTDLSKVADPSWKLFFADMFIQIAANIRAAEGKK